MADYDDQTPAEFCTEKGIHGIDEQAWADLERAIYLVALRAKGGQARQREAKEALALIGAALEAEQAREHATPEEREQITHLFMEGTLPARNELDVLLDAIQERRFAELIDFSPAG